MATSGGPNIITDGLVVHLDAANQRCISALGNLQIYNRALTAEEVLRNFNAIKNRFGL
jgi:hypothetical protein